MYSSGLLVGVAMMQVRLGGNVCAHLLVFTIKFLVVGCFLSRVLLSHKCHCHCCGADHSSTLTKNNCKHPKYTFYYIHLYGWMCVCLGKTVHILTLPNSKNNLKYNGLSLWLSVSSSTFSVSSWGKNLILISYLILNHDPYLHHSYFGMVGK